MAPTREAVVEALGNVIDPELRKPVTELDMVRDVAIREGEVTVRIALTVAGCPLRSSFQDQVAKEVGGLDADIYGHSVPHMLGLRQKPVLVDRLMIPPVKHDLKLMSIGFFLDDNYPLMWRGPMLHTALAQFLQDVHWGERDVLLVDMPPGTGDVSISLGQMLPRAEAIVVTTPQALAQEVASRAATMAQKTGMRVAGVVENMSSDVFGTGGGEQLAAELGVPLL